MILFCALAQTAWAGENPRYSDNGDGTVTDSYTGFTWMRCSMGQTWDSGTSSCTGTAGSYTWDQAMALTSNFAGHNDWRLPTIQELQSIVDYSTFDSAIDHSVFPNAPASFVWSSSPDAYDSNIAWKVYFYHGHVDKYHKTNGSGVRLVRGGQFFGFLQAHQDGTVSDNNTGLTWMRCSMGQTWDSGSSSCTGTAGSYTWDQAMALTSDFAGHHDWRLPTIQELQSIVDYSTFSPAIDSGVFPNTPTSSVTSSAVWSSSPDAIGSNNAWSVYFFYGSVSYDNKTGSNHVRLVRSGQSVSLPTISLSAVNPNSGNVDDTFIFSATLSGNLPSGYKVYANFDDGQGGWLGQDGPGGHVEVPCSGTACSLSRPIDGAGSPRRVRMGVFNSSNELQGSYSAAGEFIVNDVNALLPTVTKPTVGEGIITETGLRFTVTLSEALPEGFGVFINFDDQQGGWFDQTQLGGHLALQHQGGGVYAIDYVMQKPGLRAFRAGIFNLQGSQAASDHTLVGDYSESEICKSASCLNAIVRANGYGDPALNGSGSQLFKQVDVASGNYHLAVTDMSVSGKGPSFAFSRAYNSLSEGVNQWTFAYEAKVRFQAGTYNREISVGPREDGRMQNFYKDMDQRWYALNPGNFDELIENSDGSFILYTQGNRLFRFANPLAINPGRGNDFTGRLISIEDRLGNALTFNYSGNNLSGATDANGRVYTISRDGNNRIQRVTDFTGRYVEYSYDANAMITSVRNMRGDHYHYSYVDNTYLASMTDPRGNTQVTVDYGQITVKILGENETKRRVISLTDAVGEATDFIYQFNENSNSIFYTQQMTGISQPAVEGVNHNLAFILDNRRTRVESRLDAQDAGNYKTQQRYKTSQDRKRLAENSLVDQVVDPGNNATTINYDEVAKNRPNEITDAVGRKNLASYSAIANASNLAVITSAQQPGVATPTEFKDFTATGQAKTIIDPRNFTTRRQFDANDWLSQLTNPRNNSTSYSYDANGHVTAINEPLGRQTQRDYDELGRLIEENSPSGLRSTYTYDVHGNMLSKTDQAAGINYLTQYGYDENDNQIWTIDPRGQRTDYVYDAQNRKIEERYLVSGVQHNRLYSYDAMGRLKTVTNERSQTNRTKYDARSQVMQKINPLNENTVTYSYDANGNVATVTDGAGRVVTNTYDAINRKIKQQDQNGDYQAWTYHDNGQIATYRDGRGKITQYSYDNAGNLTATSEAGMTTTSTYDGNGNVLTVTDPKGQTTSYTYDALDRRKTTTLQNGQQWLYDYDAAGNLISEITPTGEKTLQTFDALGRMTQRTEYAANNSITRQLAYSYDANSNITSVTSGGNTISYSYDEINRINSVTDQFGQTLSYAYDKAGNRTGLTYPGNKAITYQYDNADRLDSLTDWLNKTTRYSHNPAGQVTDVINGNGSKVEYRYDTAGRLIRLKNLKADGSVISSHDLTLDGGGNITQAALDLPLLPTAPASIAGMSYDSNNRLLNAGGKSYQHDPTGRIIEQDVSGAKTIYNFTVNDLISSISQNGSTVSQYAYDLNDNRISQSKNGTETRYVIDPLAALPNVVAETNAQGVISRYYLYGEGLVSQIDAAGNSSYYHYDPTGHTLALTDANGNVTDKYAYTPYGFTTAEGSTVNPFRFVGKHGVMDDGNGLHYMRARYYKEDIKRFMSLDALHGDMLTPQALNRYAYVQGNPVMGVDPSGLFGEYGTFEYKLADFYVSTVSSLFVEPFTQTANECNEFAEGEKWTIGTDYELGGTLRTHGACVASFSKNIAGGIGVLLDPVSLAAKSAAHLYIDLTLGTECSKEAAKKLTDLYIDTAGLIIAGKNAAVAISKANIKLEKITKNKTVLKKMGYIFKELTKFQKFKNLKKKDLEEIKKLFSSSASYITNLFVVENKEACNP